MSDEVSIALIAAVCQVIVLLVNLTFTLLTRKDVQSQGKALNGRMSQLVDAAQAAARAEAIVETIQDERDRPRQRRATDPKPQE